MTIAELWLLIQSGGVPFLLFLIILAGYKEAWVWGYLYRNVAKERDEWKSLALSGTSLARHAANKVAESEQGSKS